MIEKHLDIPTADGAMNSFVVYPEEGGDWPFVMAAAAAFPDRIKGIAAIHGANLVTEREDSAHGMASRISCECYFACAEIDKWAPPEIVATLEKALRDGGTPHRIEWYPGVEHGFVFPQRAGIYNQVAAERHWERLFALFRRTLQTVAESL